MHARCSSKMNRTLIAFSATTARSLCVAMALLVLLGSLPLTTGVAFICGADRPALSLDLCHPLQSAVAGTIAVVARPAAIDFHPGLREFTFAIPERTPFSCRLSDAPENPPPEARA